MTHGKPLSHLYEDDGKEHIDDLGERDLSRVRKKIEMLKQRIGSIEEQLPEAGIYGRRTLVQSLEELEKEIKQLTAEVAGTDE